MLLARAKILYNKKIKGNYFHLVIQAPKIAKASFPGQFLMVQKSIKHFSIPLRKSFKVIAEGDFLDIRVNPVRNTKAIKVENKISNGINDAYEPLLRRPLSIHRVRGTHIELLYEVVGKATEVLSCRKPGECLDAIGPLGNGFNYPLSLSVRQAGVIRYPLPVLVAGGMGVAPLVFLAEKLKSGSTLHAPRSTLVLIGARTKNEILCKREFQELGYEVRISTDDGSVGFKGKVTELLDNILASGFALQASGSKKHVACSLQRAAQIYACGPRPMLKEISRISTKYGIPAQASLEEHMACGIGACLGCVVNTKEGFKRVCKEGPVFKADEIAW